MCFCILRSTVRPDSDDMCFTCAIRLSKRDIKDRMRDYFGRDSCGDAIVHQFFGCWKVRVYQLQIIGERLEFDCAEPKLTRCYIPWFQTDNFVCMP